ncbi:MAG: hypothetical protein M8353_08055 [ANME-2 cluster archaeon]|nr:hypothetical protein [ANME-2 cluster archaeon]
MKEYAREPDKENAQLILLSGFMIMLGTLTFMVLLNNLILTANLPTSGLDVSKQEIKEFRTLAISDIEYAAHVTLQYGIDNNVSNETLLREHFINYTDVMGETLSRVFAARGTSVEVKINNVSFTSTHGERTITVQKFMTQEHFFPNASLIIPMDIYQNNTLQTYRFVWNIVNNTSVPVYGVLQDPINSSNITVGPMVAASAALNSNITYNQSVNVPRTTVTYYSSGTNTTYNFDVDNVGSYLLGQDMNVSIYLPNETSVKIEVLYKNLTAMWVQNTPLSGGKATVTIPGNEFTSPSTYGVALLASGAIQDVKPVVVSEYTMSIETNESVVSPGDTLRVTIKTYKNGNLTNTSDSVGAVLFQGSSSFNFTATPISTGVYEADIVMPSISGRYSLYGAIATGNITLGFPEVVGIVDGGNIDVIVYSDFYFNVISDDVAVPSMGPGTIQLRSYSGGPFMIDVRNLDASTTQWIYNESLNFTPPITIHGLRMEGGRDLQYTIAINEIPSVAVYPDTNPEIVTILNYYSDMMIPYTLLNDSDIQAGSLTIDNYSILLIHENMSTVGSNIANAILNWTADGGVLYAECLAAVTMDAAVEAVDNNTQHPWFGLIGVNESNNISIPLIDAQIPDGPYVKLINSSSVLNFTPPMPLSGFAEKGAVFNQLSQTNNTNGMYGPVKGHSGPGRGFAFSLNNTTGAVNPDTNIMGYIAYPNGSQVIFDDDVDGELEYHLAYVEAPYEYGRVVYMAGHNLSARDIQSERIAAEIFYASVFRDQIIIETHNINVTLTYADGMTIFKDTVLIKI